MESLYIATAISYANGPPHIGHIYEATIADIISRYYRNMNKTIFFLTGTDEHGIKIQQTAKKLNMCPVEICNINSQKFRDIYEKMNIQYDNFIRTSEQKHCQLVQNVFRQMYQNGDIYLGDYVGWYNAREEKYITENEACISQYRDPITDIKYDRITESSYFFRMEKYRSKLVRHISENPDFIDSRHKNDIINRLQEPLQDLSISRISFDWGVPVPDAKNHIFYVWFDALCNYLSGQNQSMDSNGNFQWDIYGPPIHIIGGDIVWFHAVVWPCMLISLGLLLPKRIISHGFINDYQGQKMSKSVGNIIDPNELLDKYSPDAIRYALIRSGVYGRDIRFSSENIKIFYENELANWYGNLISRTFTLAKKYCNGCVPDATNLVTIDMAIISSLDRLISDFNLGVALETIMDQIQNINQWLVQEAPWNPKCPLDTKNYIVRCALEKIFIVTHMLEPFIPDATNKIIGMYRCQMKSINQLLPINLKSNQELETNHLIIFKK